MSTNAGYPKRDEIVRPDKRRQVLYFSEHPAHIGQHLLNLYAPIMVIAQFVLSSLRMAAPHSGASNHADQIPRHLLINVPAYLPAAITTGAMSHEPAQPIQGRVLTAPWAFTAAWAFHDSSRSGPVVGLGSISVTSSLARSLGVKPNLAPIRLATSSASRATRHKAFLTTVPGTLPLQT